MIHILIKLLATAGALLLVSRIIPGIHIDNTLYAVITALVLSLLNISVRPLLIFFTFPVTILTLGLFVFVINAFVFLLADYVLVGFRVDGFPTALLGSLLVSFISTIVYKVLT